MDYSTSWQFVYSSNITAVEERALMNLELNVLKSSSQLVVDETADEDTAVVFDSRKNEKAVPPVAHSANKKTTTTARPKSKQPASSALTPEELELARQREENCATYPKIGIVDNRKDGLVYFRNPFPGRNLTDDEVQENEQAKLLAFWSSVEGTSQ